MKYIQNLPFILSSTIKRKIKKTLNLLFLLLAVFAVSSCSSDDDEKKDSVKEITISSFPQLFYPLVTRQFFCDFHEKSEDFCVS